MSWVTQTLSSSIGKKLVMALTGLFLCSFLIVHMSGNLQLFKQDNGLAFNVYAVFMTTNPFIKTISYGLYALILLHAIEGLYVTYQNRQARGEQRYVVNGGSANSSWFSRNIAHIQRSSSCLSWSTCPISGLNISLATCLIPNTSKISSRVKP